MEGFIPTVARRHAGRVTLVAALGLMACGSDDDAQGKALMPGVGGAEEAGDGPGGSGAGGTGASDASGGTPATGATGGGGTTAAPAPDSNLGSYETYTTSCEDEVCEADEQCVDGPRGTLCVHPCDGHPCQNAGETSHCTRTGGVVCL